MFPEDPAQRIGNLSQCRASLDCRVIKAVPVATHTIFIAEVVAAELWQKDVLPLIYVDGEFKLAETPTAESMPAYDPGWG